VYICKKCGSIYFHKISNSCKCGNENLEETTSAEISEYVCDNCKSHFRNYMDKCDNCGSTSIRCYNKKEIVDLGEGVEYNFPFDGEGSLYLSLMLLGAIIVFSIMIMVEFAYFVAVVIPPLIKYQYVNIENNRLLFNGAIFLFSIIAIIGIVFYFISKNNYNNKLLSKKANWILIKNIDYELIPHKTSDGTRYKILAKLITIGDRTIIRASKELFNNPQGEFDLLIDLNNMEHYIIKQGLTLESLKGE